MKAGINTNAFIYPMPMTIVGSIVNDRPNFMAVGWINRVNHIPPMLAIGLGKSHYTNMGIHENGEFSVNIPGLDMIEVTDYVGLVTGKKKNKAELFKIFYKGLKSAPMIEDCPLCMECKLVEAIDLPSNTLFIGEIVGAFADEDVLVEGKPDIKKINPFTLTMPDNNYWQVGANAGKAWNIGKSYKKSHA